MKNKKRLIGLVIGLALVLPLSFAWAGAEGQPPAGGISGPDIWGVVVIDCNAGTGSLRVKTIDNCEVETDAFIGTWQVCPTAASNVVWFQLSGIDLTGMGISGTPIVTKVKNFVVKGDLVSFDAQIRSTP